MDNESTKTIKHIFKQFRSWAEGKNCKTGAPCALNVLIEMGLSPFRASELLTLFHDIGNCCLDNGCDLPLETNLGIEGFIPEDAFDSCLGGK